MYRMSPNLNEESLVGRLENYFKRELNPYTSNCGLFLVSQAVKSQTQSNYTVWTPRQFLSYRDRYLAALPPARQSLWHHLHHAPAVVQWHPTLGVYEREAWEPVRTHPQLGAGASPHLCFSTLLCGFVPSQENASHKIAACLSFPCPPPQRQKCNPRAHRSSSSPSIPLISLRLSCKNTPLVLPAT